MRICVGVDKNSFSNLAHFCEFWHFLKLFQFILPFNFWFSIDSFLLAFLWNGKHIDFRLHWIQPFSCCSNAIKYSIAFYFFRCVAVLPFCSFRFLYSLIHFPGNQCTQNILSRLTRLRFTIFFFFCSYWLCDTLVYLFSLTLYYVMVINILFCSNAIYLSFFSISQKKKKFLKTSLV